jgi:pimeloyl-ACP methyl ester carboxylesterase
MRQVREYLQRAPVAATWNFWDISYDTTWQSFPESARQISSALQKTGHDFEQTILIGYSMGGLVARQLVADGFSCSQLVTLCTPHHGPVRWMPVPTRGPRSLAHWNRHARVLDRHPRDVALREKYHFFAVTYRDTFGVHHHDGMVAQSSALGCKLPGVKTRRTVKLKYSVPVSAFLPIDPHWRGMFPRYISPALDHIAGLMQDEEPR